MAPLWERRTDKVLSHADQAAQTGLKNKVFIKTYGCQMNMEDSQRLANALVDSGFELSAVAEDSSLIVLNTCHIREKASEKVYSELGRLNALRAATGRPMLLAITGCVAQAEGEEIMRRQPGVDLVVGPGALHRLPALVEEVARTGAPAIALDFEPEEKFAATVPGAANASALLSVQEGCDKFCTFCVVPYTRGAEISRPVADILAEARSLVDQGAREITVLGQNVTSYHGRGPDGSSWTLARLLDELADIGGVGRLFYTTSHPRDIGDDIIAAHASIDKLAPYLHLPVQSGSDRVLRAMNRGHTVRSYLDIMGRFRAARPDIAISSDFIVGFPGETDEDFEATLSLVGEVGFASAYSFVYSPRPGTPAAGMGDRVDPKVAAERLTRLQEAIGASALRFNRALIGRTLPVLLSGRARHFGQLRGRSPYGQSVHVTAEAENIGCWKPVEIISATRNSLAGR